MEWFEHKQTEEETESKLLAKLIKPTIFLNHVPVLFGSSLNHDVE
jgi:hypothetical protein